jgi:hypothetical protein
MFAGDGLFAAIGLQLAFVATVSRGLARPNFQLS